jgi:hypothetical protein
MTFEVTVSIRTPGAAVLAVTILAATATAVVPTAATAATASASHWTRVPARPALVRYYRSDKPLPRHLGAHARFVAAADGAQDSLVSAPPAGPTQSTWQVTYTGFDAGSNSQGPQAQAAFQAAVNIWSQIVESPVTIKVDADFASLAAGVLGEAGPSTLYSNGTSFYASALADAINGSDVSVAASGPSEDIDAEFSSNPAADFYYGTDGAPPAGKIDFESVVLHELGHGLGFLGSLQVNGDGTGSASASLPFSYDHFTTSAATGGTALLSYPNNSTQLASALQNQSVYWDGKVAVASNSGVRPRLFAPTTWETGSSYSHLDETTYPAGNLNSLMTPAIGPQEAIHTPGPVAVGMLVDQGWKATLPGLAAAPGAPTGVTAAAGEASATVSWTAASSNNSTVTHYVVTASTGGRTCTTSGSLTCTVTGLSDATPYTFTVTATNGVGAGPTSSPSTAVTPGGAPGAATAVTGTPADGLVHLSWTAAPAHGYTVTQYVATAAPGGQSCTTSGATFCTVSALTDGTGYTFSVVASNSKGSGPVSMPSATITPAGLPTTPTSVSATPGDTTASVSWGASSGSGTTITGYTVTSAPGGLSCSTNGATTCTVPDLTNGTPYTFTVTATSPAGTSAASAASSSITPTGPPAAVPGAPGTPTATAAAASATVRWTAPGFDGGKAVTGYDVQYSTDGGSGWVSAATTFHSSTATSETVTGLRVGSSYEFRVAAINPVGTGAYSAASRPVVPVGDTTHLTAGVSRTIRYGESLTVRSTIKDTITGRPVVTSNVWLQSRRGTTGSFHDVGHFTSSAIGGVFLNVKPTVTSQYRWLVSGLADDASATSAIQTVRVAQAVSVFTTAHAVRRHRHVILYGVIGPHETHQLVRLQREVGSKWRTVAGKARVVRQRLPNGSRETGYSLRITATATGRFTYRVYRPATATNAAGTSKPVRLHVTA